MSVPVTMRRALLAAAATFVLAGCSTATAGLPSAAPAFGPGSTPGFGSTSPTSGEWTPEPTSRPAQPTDGVPYAQWVAKGWKPTPWQPVTDGSGVTAWMLGTARSKPVTGSGGADDIPLPGTSWRAEGAPAGVLTTLDVYRLSGGFQPVLTTTAQAVAQEQHGHVTRSQPTTVDGHPALDVSIEGFGATSGRPVVSLLRLVATPDRAVLLVVSGYASDAETVSQVATPVFASLQVRDRSY